MLISITEEEYQELINFKKENLKNRLKLAKSEGFLTILRYVLEKGYDCDKNGILKIINEILDLLK